MVKLKPLFNLGHEEMMVRREDLITLLQYLEPTNDEKLVKVVSTLCSDFSIDYADYVNSELEEAIAHKKYWDAIEEQYM